MPMTRLLPLALALCFSAWTHAAPIAESLGDPVAYVLSGTLVVGLLVLATAMRSRARRLSLSH